MANQNVPIFATMSNQESDKPSSSPKPHWLVYVLAALVVLFLLQKVGCGPVRTEEKLEWIDR
ncbi:MAG: hypothetical protein HY842_07520 [Bacteroidetes bacterium]|nr:hypothetical protein [Bacteroidota bacterium]